VQNMQKKALFSAPLILAALLSCSSDNHDRKKNDVPTTPAAGSSQEATPAPSPTHPGGSTSRGDENSPTLTVKQQAAALARDLTGGPHFMIGLDSAGGGDFENQNIKIDLFYTYLCCGYGTQGWIGWNKDGSYVNIVADRAARNGATPMFTYYQLANELEKKNYGIFTSENLRQYLKDIKLMFTRLALFGKPAIVHFEPDFFGYLQQYADAQKTTPDKIPARFHDSDFKDCDHIAETVTGLLTCMVHLGRTFAPQVKIGFAASMWGYWYNPNDPKVDVTPYGQVHADFLLSVGAGLTDLIVVETSDRDAGFLEAQNGGKADHIYWDVSNVALPNFHQHFKWVKAITERLQKPAVWWQTPLGVPSEVPGGTAEHYRDNRVAYFFSHVEELAAAGGAGMAFGTGAAGQTTIKTDGGQFARAAAGYRVRPYDLGQ
jgi:hypothetical protein